MHGGNAAGEEKHQQLTAHAPAIVALDHVVKAAHGACIRGGSQQAEVGHDLAESVMGMEKRRMRADRGREVKTRE